MPGVNPRTGRPWRFLVVGAGGHAAVLIDLIRAAGIGACISLMDDAFTNGGAEVLGVPIIGPIGGLKRIPGDVDAVALGIGDNARRVHFFALAAGRLAVPSLIHPGSSVSPSAMLGPGTVIGAGAVVGARARIGAAVIVNTGASVDHDAVVRDGAHLAPGARVAGGAWIGSRALVGLCAGVPAGIRVADDAIVAPGTFARADGLWPEIHKNSS